MCLSTKMQLPIFRITRGVTIKVQRHSKENIFVITSGIENAVILARLESPAKSQDLEQRCLGRAQSKPGRNRFLGGGLRTEASLAGKLQRVRDIFQSQTDKYNRSLVGCGAKPHPSKKQIKFQPSTNAKIINWINKVQPQRTTWKKTMPAVF